MVFKSSVKSLLATSTSHKGLTFVGVGPGDPSLLTLAAVQAIRSANLVAYPISHEKADGIAFNIVSEFITNEQERLPLLMPMVKHPEKLKEAWSSASAQLACAVSKGKQVVFLCQGDVSLFASSSYLFLHLKNFYPECSVKLIPGVTSVSAAAAAVGWPLALQQEQLLLAPTPEHPEDLGALLEEANLAGRVVVLLKLGHRWIWVKPLLEKMNLLEGSLFAQRVGWPDQQILPASEVPQSEKPYLSLLLVRQSWPEIMP